MLLTTYSLRTARVPPATTYVYNACLLRAYYLGRMYCSLPAHRRRTTYLSPPQVHSQHGLGATLGGHTRAADALPTPYPDPNPNP